LRSRISAMPTLLGAAVAGLPPHVDISEIHGSSATQARATSFYTDCSYLGRPFDSKRLNPQCEKTTEWFSKRRVLNGGIGGSYALAACKSATYIHDTETGAWEECCKKKRFVKRAPFMLDEWRCQPMEAQNHQYTWADDTKGPDLKRWCGGSACDGPKKVCLTPRRQGSVGNPVKSMVNSMLMGDTRHVCLDVGNPNSKGKEGMAGTSAPVFYMMAPPVLALALFPPRERRKRDGGDRCMGRREEGRWAAPTCAGELAASRLLSSHGVEDSDGQAASAVPRCAAEFL